MTPEKIHLVLNHIPLLACIFAAPIVIFGLIRRSKEIELTGLILTFSGSLFTGLVMGSGEEAYERYKDGPVAAQLDPAAEEWLDIHNDRAHTVGKVFYGVIGLSLLAIVARIRFPRISLWMTLIALASSLIAIAGGIWTADSGGKIRRPDFRLPPAAMEIQQVENQPRSLPS